MTDPARPDVEPDTGDVVAEVLSRWDGYGHGPYCTHLEVQLPCQTCALMVDLRTALGYVKATPARPDAAPAPERPEVVAQAAFGRVTGALKYVEEEFDPEDVAEYDVHDLVRAADALIYAEALAGERVREALGSALTDARAAVQHGAIWRGTPDNIETVDRDDALHSALIDALDRLLGTPS